MVDLEQGTRMRRSDHDDELAQAAAGTTFGNARRGVDGGRSIEVDGVTCPLQRAQCEGGDASAGAGDRRGARLRAERSCPRIGGSPPSRGGGDARGVARDAAANAAGITETLRPTTGLRSKHPIVSKGPTHVQAALS